MAEVSLKEETIEIELMNEVYIPEYIEYEK